MAPRRIKVEFFDYQGAKHTITVDGAITKEKVARILDYVELMGRLPDSPRNPPVGEGEHKLERVRNLLEQFQGRMFSSSDIKGAYERRFGEAIALSTICTYLSRFADRGVVVRSGSPAQWLYTVKPSGTFSWSDIARS